MPRRRARRTQPILKTCLELSRKREHICDYSLLAHLATLFDHRDDPLRAVEYRAAAMGWATQYAVRDTTTGYVLRGNIGSALGAKHWLSRRTRPDGTIRVEQWLVINNLPTALRFGITWSDLNNHLRSTLTTDPDGYYVFQAAAARIEMVELRCIPKTAAPAAEVTAPQISWRWARKINNWPAAAAFPTTSEESVRVETP